LASIFTRNKRRLEIRNLRKRSVGREIETEGEKEDRKSKEASHDKIYPPPSTYFVSMKDERDENKQDLD